MKRIILFFTVCLGLSVSWTTLADNVKTTRVTNKRTNVTINTNNRANTNDTKRIETGKNTRNTSKSTEQRVVMRTPTIQNIKSRATTTQIQSKNTPQGSLRTQKNTSPSRVVNSRPQNTVRSATQKNTRKTQTRAAELNTEKIENIKSADYSKCKTVYYECMDEFCANKDTNLRRCACSSRIHEFDGIKKQLSNAEDKMLDFNQRLLLVSMDKEDVAAVNVASEGELAFNKKDTSASERLLQKISKTLNDSGDSRINNSLSPISLSLDMDSAWDNIDSLSGVATTSKNGLDLYNAANPICIEMAKEVCSDDELTIVQDGYKLTIQQDCNTVSKSYTTLYNNAMNKIHESGALLDMSRLNVYQQKNSDDTLTCKKKILEQLSDNSVCGKNLYKCLDITGEYIDPSTGDAFLSENLYNLSNLIREPNSDEKWSKIIENEPFVDFLKSKKRFLIPAIEQCQDMADVIWKEFLDDALAQIKLAQNAKMEEIKRGCTTLVAECKTGALDNLSEFDARSLSVFKVMADKTANEMCNDIQNSCIALMGISDTENNWKTGMIDIAANTTFDAIIDTCAQVGRDCIIQKCNGASGNFALCTDIISDNRTAVLNRTACWNEVFNCVRGADNLQNMNKFPIVTNRKNYYENLYSNIIYDNIPVLCQPDDIPCLITEQIWGNCDALTPSNSEALTDENMPNILISETNSTLLSWFATNTNNNQSCSTYGCPVGYIKQNGSCQQLLSANQQTGDCNTPTTTRQIVDVIVNSLTNYCKSGIRDMYNNCCVDGFKNNGICVPAQDFNALRLLTTTCNNSDNYYCPNHDTSRPRQIDIYCITNEDAIMFDTNSSQYECDNGFWLMIDQYGNYFNVNPNNNSYNTSGQYGAPTMSYQRCTGCNTTNQSCTVCTYEYNNSNNSWSFGYACTGSGHITVPVPTDNEFLIEYDSGN